MEPWINKTHLLPSLSHKHLAIEASATLKIAAAAKAMKAEGIDVISLSTGEPDFSTPQVICREAQRAMDQGLTGYTGATGLRSLKSAISRKLSCDQGLAYSTEEITVSNGAKHALYNCLQAICNEGDEVIIPKPYWVSYPELVKMAGGVPVMMALEASNKYVIREEQLLQVVSKKTKAIIINSPNNPTGQIYGRDTLGMIAAFAKKHNLYIISDEIYEKLNYGSGHVSIASISQDAKSRTMVINGMSKAYAMTGWRIGYVAAPLPISKVIGNIQSHSTSNPNTIAQYASIVALENTHEEVAAFVEAFKERRDYVGSRLSAMNKVTYVMPKGAFYYMVDISQYIGMIHKGKKITSSEDFTSKLLENERVATIPGSAFGAEGYIRLSYATSMVQLEKGLDRLERFMALSVESTWRTYVPDQELHRQASVEAYAESR